MSECPVPMGKVVFETCSSQWPGGRVRVVKKAEVHGGFGSLLRLVAPKMRRETARSLAALEEQLSS